MEHRNRISLRLPNWDYSWAGVYFITTCTKDRNYYFGNVVNGEMILTNIGAIADVLWHEIPSHSKNVELGPFIVMPNHIHGILMLKNDKDEVIDYEARKNIDVKRFQNPGKNSISSIVGGYKASVTKHLRRMGYIFAWQTGFYDEIIRDVNAYYNVKRYIENNPRNWKEDEYC
ncbi:MAG: hypothetical protein J6W12_04675 [Bacteroidales bacterium]|nr:hypothetical protein [Bacteroidales bacterium]